VPRTLQYVRTLRSRPPAAPSRLDAADLVRRRRFRVTVDLEGDGSVVAEKGYLREAGTLLFHTALFGLWRTVDQVRTTSVDRAFGYPLGV
jgi:cytochrome c biogenesis protein